MKIFKTAELSNGRRRYEARARTNGARGTARATGGDAFVRSFVSLAMSAFAGFGAMRAKGSSAAVGQSRARLGGNASSGARDGRALDLYDAPPVEEHSIEYLERAARDRYALLRTIDDARSGGKTRADELKPVIRKAEEECGLRRTIGNKVDEEGAGRDAVSHFLLRLASCRNEEHRRWFVDNELQLFRCRFDELDIRQKKQFMRSAGFDENVTDATDADVKAHGEALEAYLLGDFVHRNAYKATRPEQKLTSMEYRSYCKSASRDPRNWWAVGFEHVPKLIGGRRAYLVGGKAWIHRDNVDEIVFGRYKLTLRKSLATSIELFKKFEVSESHRLAPLLKSVHNRQSGGGYAYQGEEGTMSIAGVEATQESFPLCMRQLYKALKKDHHLTHGGRRQLQLYLKGIGMPLDQALLLWKTEFTKNDSISAEKFEKDYAYGIRHAYGREGKRVNYSPHVCGQCIAAEPGVKDAHGCPFKTLTTGGNKDGSKLDELLRNLNINAGKTNEIVSKARNMHYQIACGMTFAALHKGTDIEAGVHSPHQYFLESRKILAPSPPETENNGDAKVTVAA